MTESIRIFIDERPAAAVAGATIVEALTSVDPDAGRALREGRAYVTDGVGRPLELGAVVVPGSILRLVRSSRAPGSSTPAP